MPWTLVQHSGYGYGQNPGFEHALEERSVESKREINLIIKEGGVVLDTYVEASELAFELNYPGPDFYMYPRFAGTFSEKCIDGLRIAVPIRKVVAQ